MNIPTKDRFGKSFGRITIDEFLKRNYPEFREYIDIKYKDSASTQEKVYRYFNNIENIPLCPTCGNPARFHGYSYGYAKYCSQSCAGSNSEVQRKVHDSIVKNYGDNYKNIFKEKSKTSCLKKYGVSNPMQCDEFKEKLKNTYLRKYGVPNPMQCDEFKEKSKITCLKRYGVEYTLQANKIKDKSKETCLKRYDVEYTAQTDRVKNKSKETCLKQYGVEYALQSPAIREKIKQTNREKYGVECPLQSDLIRDKIIKSNNEKYGGVGFASGILMDKTKQTIIERYGVEYAMQSDTIKDKIKQTCLEKYGVENYMQSDDYKSHLNEIQDKIKQTSLERYGVENPFQSEEIKNKAKQTNIERYGTEYYAQSNEGRDKLSKILSSKEVQDKINNTKRLNNTFSTSKIEEEFESYLNEQRIEHVRQYKSEKYPFSCDFYILKYDLYIEIQGTWLHGGHPYNEEKDKEKLEHWKSKQTKFYDNAIETWTIRDVKKRNIAKLNKLNYLEIFSNEINEVIEQFEYYINKYNLKNGHKKHI